MEMVRKYNNIFIVHRNLKQLWDILFTPGRMTMITKQLTTYNRGPVHQRQPLFPATGIANWSSHSGNQYKNFSKDEKTKLPNNPACCLPRASYRRFLLFHEYLITCVNCHSIHKAKNWEQLRCSLTAGWMMKTGYIYVMEYYSSGRKVKSCNLQVNEKKLTRSYWVRKQRPRKTDVECLLS